MKLFNTALLCFIFLFVVSSSSSYSQISIRSDSYGSKAGYIDKATLIVEPHGAYVEQSLYLSYSDHLQFPSANVEIVHRFELPANSVINDMWLWIGDSVMQARMFDTWTARAIYDSIVSKKRDPAFLSKNGNIYELHIYPLTSGSFRKIKLNFLTPTRWLGTDGVAELPLKMLKDNNASKKPLQILFRETDHIWGQPFIKELPQLQLGHLVDSSGYKYYSASIADLSSLTTFTLGFTTGFVNGCFSTTADVKGDATYFQFGFMPGTLFDLKPDPASKHLLFAFDLSGIHNKTFATLLPKLREFVQTATKPNDSITVVVAGKGKIEAINPVWRIGHPDTINALIERFGSSAWGLQIAVDRLPNILYADAWASMCWQFPGLEKLATSKGYANLQTAILDFKSADIIAAYGHGYEDISATAANIQMIIAKIDSFFARGGRFLSYYDYNRVGRELIGSHYIAGLTTTRRPDGSTTLYRNPGGNIGKYFPESFVHYGFDYLAYTPDSTVKVEVQDNQGRAVVISKKISNGLLVISGIWSFRDDAALRTQLGVPLLGLNQINNIQQLTGLFDDVQSRTKTSPIDKVILASNSDSLFQKSEALAWTDAYMKKFTGASPKFMTINLLDGEGYVPATLTEGQTQYYGSGYLLKTIADASKGAHFETHLDALTYIDQILNAYSNPTADSLTVSVTVNGGAGQLRELREVNPTPGDPNKARFFIGAAPYADVLRFDIRAKFNGIADEKSASPTLYAVHDTTRIESVIPAMLGNIKLQDMFNQPVKDTAAIVGLAMRYRLLCDFTSLLALEPNDTIHFMKDPFDESGLTSAPVIDITMADSIGLWSYPNPFNNQTSIILNIRNRSLATVGIYNILGQLVKTLAADEAVEGKKTYFWNGTDSANRVVSSGSYFVRMIVKETSSGRTAMRFRKVVFLK